MPLLSRVYKQPRVSGIYDYRVSPEVETETYDTAALMPVCNEAESPGDLNRQHKESCPLSESDDHAIAADGVEECTVETATRQGYLEGLAEGKAEAESRSKELLEEAFQKLDEAEREAASCLQQARQKAREIVRASEADIVELSVAIAEKLIQDQLEIAPHKVARIVKESIGHFSDEEAQLEVYLHPEDLVACRKNLDPPGGSAAEARLKLLPDERLSRGSCRVESESSTAEYLMNDELKKIRETLLQIASAAEQGESGEEELTYASH